ncbi:hypothetical protein [Baaleninema simplex]|uniref:hypothetical protein n=1 Tax=Baaleninema simplex TaxID=2862350 RepID=UPI0011819C45|nr:hypothetical protein [Baaleninema simplex]
MKELRSASAIARWVRRTFADAIEPQTGSHRPLKFGLDKLPSMDAIERVRHSVRQQCFALAAFSRQHFHPRFLSRTSLTFHP